MIFWSLVFLGSLFLLIKSSDYFVDASLIIGNYLKIPQHIIGITLVALGTSLPELASSIATVLKGSSEVVLSTVVGSNTSNILLILGITAIASKKIDINLNELKRFLPFLILSVVWLIIACFDSVFSRFDALLAITLMVIFIATCMFKNNSDKEEKEHTATNTENIKKQVLIFCASIAAIYFSAVYLIESLQNISALLGIGEDIIALSALALGTSLPELVVTINATRKAKHSVAIGNIVGSNIFNSFAITGIPALIQPLLVTQNVTQFSLPIMAVATLLFLLFIIDSKITRLEGFCLVTGYMVFICWLFFNFS